MFAPKIIKICQFFKHWWYLLIRTMWTDLVFSFWKKMYIIL